MKHTPDCYHADCDEDDQDIHQCHYGPCKECSPIDPLLARGERDEEKRGQFLRDFCDYLKPYMEDGEDLNGGDAVDWLNQRYFEARELLKK